MFKNILVIVCVAMLAGCGGKANDAAVVNNQGACPAGQYRDQNNNCQINYNNGFVNGANVNNCPVGQVFATNYNQCLTIGNCPSGQALINANSCVAVTTATNNYNYPNNGYPQQQVQQCQQGYVFVTQFNSCLPMMQGCPQGWGYNQSTNLCYASANYNNYNTGGGRGGIGFNFCIGTFCP